jgi:sigma-B regulation protein RsbU (phosphoserine phosphatase)
MGFVTALYGVYDAAGRTFRYSCAGHCRPLVWRRATGRAEEAACEAVTPLVIGPLADVPVNDLALEPGDRVLFYTDGIVERTDPAGTFYGLDRLAAAVCATAADPPPAAVRRMVESVEAFAGGSESADDQTLLLGVVR